MAWTDELAPGDAPAPCPAPGSPRAAQLALVREARADALARARQAVA